MKRRYLLLEFLQDNDGNMFAFYYDLEKGICMNFRFWEWLEMLNEIRSVVYDDHNEDCDDCFYKQDHEEGEDDVS